MSYQVNKPYSVRRSATSWLRKLYVSSRSTFRSPKAMVSRPLNRFSSSSNSGRCYSVKEGMYALTSGARVGPVTISQLTTFGPWKIVDSIPHLLRHFLVTRHTPHWAPSPLDGHAFEHVKSYPRQLWEYASVWIFVSVRSITSDPPHYNARMAYANPKPLTSHMFSVLVANPGGRPGRRRSGGSAVCRRSVPWRIGW